MDSEKKTLTLEMISKLGQVEKLEAKEVNVSEWGPGLVAYVAQLTANERDERLEVWWGNRKKRLDRKTNEGLRAFAVAACLCDENRRLFATTAEEVDSLATTLGARHVIPMSRLFDHVCALNALLASDVEELEKN